MTTALGKISFLDTPDVNGVNVLTQTDLTTTLTNLVVPGTEGIGIPAGTTAQRPVSPVLGETRFNSTIGVLEDYNGTSFVPTGKLVQSVSGNIPASTATANKTTTSTPTTAEGFAIWTQSFTPSVVGSNIIVQFSVVASHATAGRQAWVAAFAGATCIGMTANYISAASSMVNLIIQCVYTSTSLAAVTFSARAGTYNGTNALFINQNSASVSFGSALSTEYRILEIV